MNIGSLVVTLGADMSQLTTGLSKANSALQRFGFVASAALTAPMVAAGKASFEMAKDYEYAIQTIVGLTGTAQSVVDGLNQSILKMAPELARNPLELAQGAYYIMSSGIKDATKAMDVLTVSAKAATAGLGETQAIANVLTSALNAYAGTGISASYAADVLTAGVREGKAEAQGFSTALGQIIPIASNLGVSFDQVVGGMAAITLTGASAANAAVYLKGIFNSLITASAQGEKALKIMGSSYLDLRNILAEQGLVALMQKLRDIQVRYGDELLSDVIPNIRAMTAFMSFAGKNFKYNTELMERVTNSTGSLGEAFAAVADTIKVRYDTAINRARVSLINLGTHVATAFIPILEWMARVLKNITQWFESLSETQRRNVLVIAALVAALGPLSLVLSSLIWILRGLLSLFPLLTAGVSAFTLSFTGISIIAIPAIIALTKKIVEIRAKINEMKEAMDFSDRGMELDTIISKKMRVLPSMNLDELSQLKQEVAERIALDRQRLLSANGFREEDAKKEAEYVSLMNALKEKQLLWEDVKARAKRGVITPEEKTLFGSNISLEIQQIQTKMNQFVADRKAYYDYEKTAAQGNIDYYSKIGVQIDKQIKKQEKLNGELTTAIERVKELEKLEVKIPEVSTLGWQSTKNIAWDFWKDNKKTILDTSGKLYKGKWEEEAKAVRQYNENLEVTRNIIDRMDKTFVELFTHIGGGFKGMIEAMLDAFKLLLAQLAAKAALFALLQLFLPGSNLAVHALTSLRKFVGFPGYANGTNYATGGLSLVGERGPELVNLPRGAQVLPNLGNIGLPRYEERLVAEVSADQIQFILRRKERTFNSFR